MTLFILEDVDTGETLRIANDCGQCAGTGNIDSGAPTPWGDYYQVSCPSCDGTGHLEDHKLAVTVTDDNGAVTIFLSTGQLARLRDWLTEHVTSCAECNGTGVQTIDTGATPWCTEFIDVNCPACNGTGTLQSTSPNQKDNDAEIAHLRAQIEELTADVLISANQRAIMIDAFHQIRDTTLYQHDRDIATQVLTQIGVLQP